MRNTGIALLSVCSLFVVGCAQRQADVGAPRGAVVTSASAAPNVVPAGTSISIRTDQEISSDTAKAGQIYAGTVAQPIMNSQGETLVPTGAKVEMAVVESKTGGTTSSADLELALRSVTVNGRRYPVSSAVTDKDSEGQIGANRRTAAMVGGGAVLGGLIGAIAGGGTGAAIGAAAGAGAGAAGQVLTDNAPVRAPAESILTFKLNQSIQLEGWNR
ncbi:MAG TPA: hypothetical protein VN428_03790 [Bryobacteraceae bacterium]|nr:hypothetical protein [Bryobacteraceae bacterium]